MCFITSSSSQPSMQYMSLMMLGIWQYGIVHAQLQSKGLGQMLKRFLYMKVLGSTLVLGHGNDNNFITH